MHGDWNMVQFHLQTDMGVFETHLFVNSTELLSR